MLLLSVRELRKETSFVLRHLMRMSARVLHRPLMPVLTYCVPVDSTYSTYLKGTAGSSKSVEIGAPARPKLLRGVTSMWIGPDAPRRLTGSLQTVGTFAAPLAVERKNFSANTYRSSRMPAPSVIFSA